MTEGVSEGTGKLVMMLQAFKPSYSRLKLGGGKFKASLSNYQEPVRKTEGLKV